MGGQQGLQGPSGPQGDPGKMGPSGLDGTIDISDSQITDIVDFLSTNQELVEVFKPYLKQSKEFAHVMGMIIQEDNKIGPLLINGIANTPGIGKILADEVMQPNKEQSPYLKSWPRGDISNQYSARMYFTKLLNLQYCPDEQAKVCPPYPTMDMVTTGTLNVNANMYLKNEGLQIGDWLISEAGDPTNPTLSFRNNSLNTNKEVAFTNTGDVLIQSGSALGMNKWRFESQPTTLNLTKYTDDPLSDKQTILSIDKNNSYNTSINASSVFTNASIGNLSIPTNVKINTQCQFKEGLNVRNSNGTITNPGLTLGPWSLYNSDQKLVIGANNNDVINIDGGTLNMQGSKSQLIMGDKAKDSVNSWMFAPSMSVTPSEFIIANKIGGSSKIENKIYSNGKILMGGNSLSPTLEFDYNTYKRLNNDCTDCGSQAVCGNVIKESIGHRCQKGAVENDNSYENKDKQDWVNNTNHNNDCKNKSLDAYNLHSDNKQNSCYGVACSINVCDSRAEWGLENHCFKPPNKARDTDGKRFSGISKDVWMLNNRHRGYTWGSNYVLGLSKDGFKNSKTRLETIFKHDGYLA